MIYVLLEYRVGALIAGMCSQLTKIIRCISVHSRHSCTIAVQNTIQHYI